MSTYVGVNTSKIRSSIHHGDYALKKYKKVPSAHNSLAYLISGPIDPVVMNDDVGKMPKKLDPIPWHPNYMRLHGRREILDLGHKNCASERGEAPLWLLIHRLLLVPPLVKDVVESS
jgi:hypothetical protein